MKGKHRDHDEYLVESLRDPKEAALFLSAAAEEDDPVVILDALAIVARALGVSKTAKKASLSRMGLYKTLSKKGNPEFRTLLAVLSATGLRLSFRPRA